MGNGERAAMVSVDPLIRWVSMTLRRSAWWIAADVVGYVNVASLTFALVWWLIVMSLATSSRDFMGDERVVSPVTTLQLWLLGIGLLAALAWLIVAVAKTYQRRRIGPILLLWHGAALAVLSTPQMIPVLDPHTTAGSGVFAVLIWPAAILTVIVSGCLLVAAHSAERKSTPSTP